MRRIRLVHFTSSLKIGGAEKVLFDLITHFDTHKYEQTVIFIHDGPYRERFNALGISTYCVHGFFMRYDPWILIRLWRLLKKLKPNVLHTLLWAANFFGRIVAQLLAVPCVAAVHNNSEQNGFVRNVLDTCVARMANASLVAVSQEVAQSVVRCTWIPAKKIKVIPNGVKVNNNTVVTRSMIGLSAEHFIIGSVGRFHLVKRYDLLLKMFANIAEYHTQVRLVLLGVGELEQDLRKLANTLGISDLVTFIIAQPAQNYYQLFDCFVQTSAQEGISIALLEAMSFGVPCVVMNVGPAHSVVEHGKTGFVVPADDQKGFIKTIEQLIKDDSLRASLGQHAQAEVQERFSLEHMVKSYDLLFNDMIFFQN